MCAAPRFCGSQARRRSGRHRPCCRFTAFRAALWRRFHRREISADHWASASESMRHPGMPMGSEVRTLPAVGRPALRTRVVVYRVGFIHAWPTARSDPRRLEPVDPGNGGSESPAKSADSPSEPPSPDSGRTGFASRRSPVRSRHAPPLKTPLRRGSCCRVADARGRGPAAGQHVQLAFPCVSARRST
jgi:hypothetical protein